MNSYKQRSFFETIQNKSLAEARMIAIKNGFTISVTQINERGLDTPLRNITALNVSVQVPYEAMIEGEDGIERWNPLLNTKNNRAIVVGLVEPKAESYHKEDN